MSVFRVHILQRPGETTGACNFLKINLFLAMLGLRCNACPPSLLLLLPLGAPAGGAVSPRVYWMMASTQLGRRPPGSRGCRKPGDTGRLHGNWQQARDA